MRLALSLLCTLLAPALAAKAAEEFNPYQATLDGMAMTEAMPLIEARYGPTKEPTTYDNGAVTVVGGTDKDFAVFLFCAGKMAGASAPVSPTTAAKILEPIAAAGARIDVYPTNDGVTLTLLDRQLQFSYWGVGSKSSRVNVSYPHQVFLAFDFPGHCAELASAQ